MSTVITGTPVELFTESFLNFIRASLGGKRVHVEIDEEMEMDETDCLLRAPAMRGRLLQSIADINNGVGLQTFTLDELREKA